MKRQAALSEIMEFHVASTLALSVLSIKEEQKGVLVVEGEVMEVMVQK